MNDVAMQAEIRTAVPILKCDSGYGGQEPPWSHRGAQGVRGASA